FGWGDTTDFRLEVQWYTDGNAYFVVENNGASTPHAALAGTGWHRFLMSWDGTLSPSTLRTQAYIDGVNVPLTAGGGAIPTLWPAHGNFRIGVDLSAPHFSAGAFDDITMWNRPLTPAEAWLDYDLSRRGYPGVLNRIDAGLWMRQAAATTF